jgi:hypothetical protein
MALKAADKKVVDAFTDGKLDMREGPKSSYYIRAGVLRGPANSELAISDGWNVKWVGVGGTKYQDDTYRYLKKTVPKNRFFEGEPRRNGFFTRHLRDTKLSKAEEEHKLTPSEQEDYEYGLHLGFSPAQAKQYALKKNGSSEFRKAQRIADDLNDEVDRASARLNQISGASKGPMGLIPAHIKAKPAWKSAKRDYDRAFAKLRAFNSKYVKVFKKELAEERRQKRAGLSRNSSTSDDDWANEVILSGFVLGFWLQGWADAMDEAGLSLPHRIDEDSAPEPPEELNDFAMKFGLDLSEVNGNKMLWEMAQDSDVSEDELEDFGYYIAMESLGHGVSWADSHDDHDLKVPSTEVHFELEDPEDEDSATMTWAESSKRLAR